MQGKLCDGIDTVTPSSGEIEMIQKTTYSLLLWMGATVTLILAIDFVFSLYKITEFREAIADVADFTLVITIYLVASFAAMAICICYASILMKAEPRKRMGFLLKIGIGLNGLLLLLNVLPLQHWSNLALERKNFSLIVSMTLGVLLVYWSRRLRPL